MTGCVSQPKPPSPQTRAQFGQVDIVATSNSPLIVEGVAGKSSLGRNATDALSDGAKGPEPFGAAVALVAAPVIAVVGRAYGAVAGEADDVAAENTTLLRRLAAARSLENELRANVAARLKDRPAAPVDHTSTLKLSLYEPGLRVDGANLRFIATVSVRVIASTGKVLFYDYLTFRGPSQKSTVWAAENGKAFLEAINQGIDLLAGEIVDQAFLRRSFDSATADRLRAAGLVRDR